MADVFSVPITLLSPTAKVPTRSTTEAAGFDVYADNEHDIVLPARTTNGNDGNNKTLLLVVLSQIGFLAVMWCGAWVIILELAVLGVVFYKNRNNRSIAVTIKVPLNIAVALPAGYYVNLRERSGRALDGLVVAAGVIDSDYRGQVSVVVRNAGSEALCIRRGDRVAQMVVQRHEADRLCFSITRTPTLTERGSRGFGSSGN